MNAPLICVLFSVKTFYIIFLHIYIYLSSCACVLQPVTHNILLTYKQLPVFVCIHISLFAFTWLYMYFYRFNCFPSRLTCLSIYLFPWIFFVSIISTFFARWLCKFLRIFLFSYFARNVHLSHFNPFFPSAPFIYPLKI